MSNGIYCIPLQKKIQDASTAVETAQDASCIWVSGGDGVPDLRDEVHDAVHVRDEVRSGDGEAGEAAQSVRDGDGFRHPARCR